MGSAYDKAVGERAARARTVLSMTEKYVADRLGITRQTLGNYESGRTSMRAAIIRDMCELYGINPSCLLGMTDEITITSKVGGRLTQFREESQVIPSPMPQAKGCASK